MFVFLSVDTEVSLCRSEEKPCGNFPRLPKQKFLMKPTNDTSIHGAPFHEEEDTDATVLAHEVSPPID